MGLGCVKAVEVQPIHGGFIACISRLIVARFRWAFMREARSYSEPERACEAARESLALYWGDRQEP